jgi:5-aminolevulinate synthase
VKSSAVSPSLTSLLCAYSLTISLLLPFELNVFPTSPGPSHIVPVLVGDAALAKAASDKLLTEHNIYVQSINYPTVAVGEERLRITVTPRHTLDQMDKLVRALDTIFTELKINRQRDWEAVGGRAGVGVLYNAVPEPMWNDRQLGLLDGTTPRTLRNGEKPVVDAKAVAVARARFNTLLGKVEAPAPKVFDGLAGLKMKTGGVPTRAGKMRVGGAEEVQMPVVPQTVAVSA